MSPNDVPATNPPFFSGLGTGTGIIFWFLWQGFEVSVEAEFSFQISALVGV